MYERTAIEIRDSLRLITRLLATLSLQVTAEFCASHSQAQIEAYNEVLKDGLEQLTTALEKQGS